MTPTRASTLALVALTLATPRLARAADGKGDNEVEVHEFDPKTGQDAAMARRSTSVTYLSPGPIVSFVGGRQPATGWGVEVSAMHYPRGTWAAFGFGGFAQAQLYSGRYTRFALGAQGGFANVGAELGLAYRAGDAAFTDTVSVHGGIYLSLAFLVMTLRDTLPLNGFGDGQTSKMGFGSEVGVTISLKLPIIIQGHDPAGFSILGGS